MANKDPLLIPNALADYLQTSAVGTVGTDIFVLTMPQSPVNVVAIIPTGGPRITGNPTRFPQFQISVRNTNIESALPKAQEINNLIEEQSNILSEINGRFELESELGVNFVDSNGHRQVVMNYTFRTASQN